MKFLYRPLVTLLFIFLFSECSNRESEAPLSKKQNTIRIKGSDTEYAMVKHLAELYMTQHPEVEITVEGGGSNKGIEALIKNEIDICNSSREIREDEMPAISEKSVSPVPLMFSVDALAIITNHLVGVDSLSMQHVSDLFSGKIKNWKELGGYDLSVKLYGRNKSSGTYDYFIDKFLALKPKGNIVECETNKEILDAVINNEGAVGYVGVGFLHDESGKPNGKIWAAPIYIDSQQAVSPYQSLKVKKGEYVLTRPLYQYVNGVPNELIQDFILFELTKQGQDIVMSHGFFPINDYQTQINRLKGLIH